MGFPRSIVLRNEMGYGKSKPARNWEATRSFFIYAFCFFLSTFLFQFLHISKKSSNFAAQIFFVYDQALFTLSDGRHGAPME